MTTKLLKEQLSQANIIYKQMFYYVLLNAEGSGWLDVKLPVDAIGRVVSKATVAALDQLAESH